MGSSLSSALEKYLSLSEKIGGMTLLDDTCPGQFISQIDSALQTRHAVLNQQLAQAHSRLAQTRNALSSRTYTLPREIFSEIFMSVVYAPPGTTQDASMDTTLLHIFRNLYYSLQCVCRVWRDIIISQGSFWYFAPMYCAGIPPLLCTRGPGLSLERSKNDLHLAAVMKFNPSGVLTVLRGGSRFRAVNLSTHSHSAIRDLILAFLEPGPPLALSEHSLHKEGGHHENSQHRTVRILSGSSSKRPAFCELLKTLTVLRISGAQFDWSRMNFSSRLVEVRIQDVTIGPDSVLIEFLGKLSSASMLRDLKIISIQSSFDSRSMGIVAPEKQLHFPSLGSLYVEDLACNSLITVLYHISHGSHHLAIHLTERCFEFDDAELDEFDDLSLEDFCVHLKNIPVDTLILGEDQEWLADSGLNDLLRSMPGLKTLKISGWLLGEEEWKALVPPLPPVEGSDIANVDFPKLQYLDLSCIQVLDEEFLKEVVTDHLIQRLVLGGLICTDPESSGFSAFQGDEAILDWLRLNVPEFILRDSNMQPPEFSSSLWQLW